MSLYLCVFDQNRELAGIEVGSYSDFNAFRQRIVDTLEQGRPGSRFPTLIRHSDCAGEWTVPDCGRLQAELAVIAAETTARRTPVAFSDIEGEPLLDQLAGLVRVALAHGRPILFQ